jgi:hypothetical protein
MSHAPPNPGAAEVFPSPDPGERSRPDTSNEKGCIRVECFAIDCGRARAAGCVHGRSCGRGSGSSRIPGGTPLTCRSGMRLSSERAVACVPAGDGAAFSRKATFRRSSSSWSAVRAGRSGRRSWLSRSNGVMLWSSVSRITEAMPAYTFTPTADGAHRSLARSGWKNSSEFRERALCIVGSGAGPRRASWRPRWASSE